MRCQLNLYLMKLIFKPCGNLVHTKIKSCVAKIIQNQDVVGKIEKNYELVKCVSKTYFWSVIFPTGCPFSPSNCITLCSVHVSVDFFQVLLFFFFEKTLPFPTQTCCNYIYTFVCLIGSWWYVHEKIWFGGGIQV